MLYEAESKSGVVWLLSSGAQMLQAGELITLVPQQREQWGRLHQEPQDASHVQCQEQFSMLVCDAFITVFSNVQKKKDKLRLEIASLRADRCKGTMVD